MTGTRNRNARTMPEVRELIADTVPGDHGKAVFAIAELIADIPEESPQRIRDAVRLLVAQGAVERIALGRYRWIDA